MLMDYVDIGTSDFETSLDVWQPGCRILLVEPLQHYLCALDQRPGVFKMCAAISDYPGQCEMFHVPHDVIKTHGLPDWVRGCNRMMEPHPTVVKLLQNNSLPVSIIQQQSAIVLTFHQLCEMYSITQSQRVKIDTEGHDHVILKQVIDRIKNQLLQTQVIQYERIEAFGNVNQLREQEIRLDLMGYTGEIFGDNAIWTKISTA